MVAKVIVNRGVYPSVTTNQKDHQMTKSSVLFCGALFTFAAVQCTNAQVIADWTFETSVPNTSGPYSPEIGVGSATGSHSGAAVFSSPAGNGSLHSYSANTWAIGDYYQFQVSTLGLSGISVSYDQISSSTGPGQFTFQYSTDGSIFSSFGLQYNVLVNSSPNNWSTSTPISGSSYSFNLISITALDNASTVYFRVIQTSTLSASQANGGATAPAAGGTDRIDNFIVSATPVPEPTTLALVAFGGMSALLAFRKRS
jgi:hypothetical protein